MTNSKLKLPAIILAFVLILTGAVVGSVKAFSNQQPPKVVVEGNYIEAVQPAPIVQEVTQPEETLGAVSSPDSLPALVCTNDFCTHTVQVSTFVARSTTIVSIPSPFEKATSTGAGAEVVIRTDGSGIKYTSATATVDLVRVDITGAATTSFHLACAGSASPTGVLPFHNPIVTTSPAVASYIATSSIGVIENNLSLAQGGLAGAGSVAKVTVNSALPYLVCTLNPSELAAITNADETLNGKAWVRFTRPRY